MRTKPELPSYETLFGELDFKKGDDARSVYSPAAYLTDLLQLLDDKFGTPTLYARRGDIQNLLLNAENTFTEVPYLDIVNEILAKAVGSDAYATLKTTPYPFPLPFHLENEQFKKYLHALGITPEQLYKAFALQPDATLVARERLGLSQEEYDFVTTALSAETAVKAGYGLDSTETLLVLAQVERFLKTTGLSGQVLRELLFQDLCESAQSITGKTERTQTTLFFIHHNLGGYVTLGQDENSLVWHVTPKEGETNLAPAAGPQPIPMAWFERVNRFVRLAQKIGFSFTELDLALRSCCHNQLDENAIHTLAVIQHLHEQYALPMDVICSCFSPLNILCIGDETTPKDLFNQIFNAPFAAIEKKYITVAGMDFLPQAYKGYTRLACTGDLLALENKEYRRRLVKALAISDKDLIYIVTQFREKYAADKSVSPLLSTGEPDLAALSLLYRIIKLAEILDISHTELFCLLDILEKDPSIRKYNNFNLLIERDVQTLDCYKILSGGDVSAALWLVQLLLAIVAWMQANSFSAEELSQILSGRAKSLTAQTNKRNQQIAVLDNLYQQFKPVMLEAAAFISSRFDERSARVIFETVTAAAAGLASSQDKRLVRFDPALAATAAYQAITQLAVISKADFMQLGLEERLLDKIFHNLILKGYLTADGELIEEQLPKEIVDFVLTTDFRDQQEALFMLIHELYSMEEQEEALDAPADVLVAVALYPSDLEELTALTAAQRDELYDNLIFNGYIDADGAILLADFFASPENVADFAVNADLSAVAGAVFKQILQQVERFTPAPLTLDVGIFAELPLRAAEIDDLVENLRFNEYLDAHNQFVNKGALLTQNLTEFNLALAFYPLRRPILEAIQQSIHDFKASFYTFTREDFRTIADDVMAQQVMAHLEDEYLRNDSVDDAMRAFFLDPENKTLFQVGSGFTQADNALIFDQIASLFAQQQPYELPVSMLEEEGFDAEETAELLEVLMDAGYLTDGLFLPESKIGYFLNVDNALEFSLEAFEDYNKDLFFVLHAAAKEMAAAMDEIVATFKTQAENQTAVVFEVLQEAFGVDSEVVKIICEQVLGGLDRAVEALLPPVLAVVDANDRVATEPVESNFTLAYNRMGQFALLAAKLGLNAVECAIVFRDQDLAAKFPEKLALPPGIDRFDALWTSPDGVIYLFQDNRYWSYAAQSYTLLMPPAQPISALAERFGELTKIDAAFTDATGAAVIIGRDLKKQSRYFYRAKESKRWVEKARTWGQIQSNFADPAAIDTAFQDQEGKTYLFAGDQYIRYSGPDYSYVDEGYPRAIARNWENEGFNAQLPSRFKHALDASFQGADGKTYLFKDNQYVGSAALSTEMEIKSKWSRVRNNYQRAARLDAAYADGAQYYLFAGDQVIVYQDSLENDQVVVREGYPQRIEAHFAHLPAEFESGLEAAFKGADGRIHLFKDGKTIAFKPGESVMPAVPIETRWGLIVNQIRQRGQIDAAFVGLDGKTYLFSADQYVRYSGADYTQVDEGYPRLIAGDWGGLQMVDAAFVLDGKTYLFGADANGAIVYLCYSKRDYSQADEGYPKTPNDNWWNLPFHLVQPGSGFTKVDAVFTGKDNRTYLFAGEQFIVFDHKQRWWSEPQALRTQWDSIPFTHVDAAFVGKDGKTYIFADHQYIRYSGSNYSKIDDRYPNAINTYWGNVVNNIAKTGKVDAALIVESPVLVNGAAQTLTYTYLFSGNQYVRYVGDQYASVENGYPKAIATSLKTEPRFQHLALTFANGLDAAFADRRNLYLFKDAQWHVIANALYQVYDLDFAKAGCAFLDEGALLVEAAGRWLRYSALEGESVVATPMHPVLLRSVPDKFQQELDAVLKGVDQNSYLFKGAACFNVLLNKEYPLAEEWGRPRSNIDLYNRVDAAFVGRDHKTYLFSGDQFVTYTGAVYLNAEIDGLPRSIETHWGGLHNVALAYVQGEKTYLFEKADSEGNFRYVCYSTADYTQPDAGFPQTADLDFWQIPAQYRGEGFREVTAVLFEGENQFLISHDQFLQFHTKTGVWSYPRPLHRIWRDLPLDKLIFPHVKTAFTGADGATYFFSEERYTRYRDQRFTPSAPIHEHWGRMHNNFVNNQQGNKIDAAFVYQHKITYLFSGDQYVRYSSSDYRTVDAGYPKPLVGNLRQEAGFQNLPDAFEDLLLARVEQKINPVIDAVVANERNLYLFLGGQCHVVSQSLTATYDLGLVGRVKNRLLENNKVDAAFVDVDAQGNAQTFLFAGDQYVRYTGDAYEVVDDGYPKAIAAAFASEMGIGALPAAFQYGIDAALRTGDGSVYLFKGKEYLKLGEAAPTAIKETWGKVRNRFVEDPADTAIDAAFVAPNGGFYVFKQDQYLRYQTPEQPFVDEGYPKAIKDNWGNLPVDFEAGIDGGFVFEGKTYLCQRGEYVRYSDPAYPHMDAIYPQPFVYRWGAWADYLLTDLQAITRFKQLQEEFSSADGTLADFLNTEADAIQAPYELLAAIFDWDLDEVKWLKRHNGFLSGKPLLEEQFHIELILKLFDIFALARKLGAAPSDLYANVWQKRYASLPAPLTAAQQVNATLYRYLALTHNEKEWPARAWQLHNELNLLKRNALAPYVMAHQDGVENVRDLYEHFLIDVEMGSAGVASKIQEAIAATQLYVHRYFVNLETMPVKDGKDEEVRQSLKSWWQWMKNYRVWEANRKVFLYPENYIRPELRDTKTPAFKTLEDDLLQGEITPAAVERAYKKYLDEYTEVSRLTIAGGYVYQPAGTNSADRKLVLFGRTKTDPRRYYYRMAEFLAGEKAAVVWMPWLNVNVQIDADKVYPVFAFHRVFVFWAKVETVAQSGANSARIITDADKNQTITASAPPTYVIKIYYSFYNLNKEWAPAQTLANSEITLQGKIEQVKLFVENSDKLIAPGNKGDHENIIINCSYVVNGVRNNRAFSLAPELYTEKIYRGDFDNLGAAIFDQIFVEPAFADASVVMFNTLEKSTDGLWFSFDHKGGSFLCRPDVSPLGDEVWPNPFAENKEGFPQEWSYIDAAFQGADGKTYFFNNANRTYVVADAHGLDQPQASKERWGKVANNIIQHGVVDATLTRGNKLYLFSGNQYLTYSGGLDLADGDCPKTLSTNNEGLPQWAQIDAAFTAPDGKSYFFNHENQQFVTLVNNQIVSTQSVREQWGRVRDRGATPVTLAFTVGGSTYLVYGNRHIRFQGATYAAIERGYPQPFDGLSALAGLEFTTVTSMDLAKVTNVFFAENALYFQSAHINRLQRFVINVDKPTGNGFFKHLDRPLKAVVFQNGRLYVFKVTTEDGATFTTLCIYEVKSRKWLQHTVKLIDSQGQKIMIDHALVGTDGAFYLFAGNQYMKSTDWLTLIQEPESASRARGQARGKEEEQADKDREKAEEKERKEREKAEEKERKEREKAEEKDKKEQEKEQEEDKKEDGKEGEKEDKESESVEPDTTNTKQIRWQPEPGSVAQDWLHLNQIARTGKVDAAFVAGNHTYLFSGDQYIRYTGSEYDFMDEEYPKFLQDNDENLPRWNRVDAVLAAAGNRYFFDKSAQIYVEAGQWERPLPTRQRWGIIRNNFTELGVVDAAYVVDNQRLYLTSGKQFIRYTLTDGNAPGEFVDVGYPQTIENFAVIDAAFIQGAYLYCFAGDRYFKLPRDQELNTLAVVKNVQGNWGNLPYELRSGMDAALNLGEILYLFKNGQYAKYALGAGPYELADAPYEIIRLTTSTAYKLNQKLFAGGVPALLALATQETDELPSFSTDASSPTNIQVRPGKVKVEHLPISSHLDFQSANGLYYWEVFFHAPFLIAQALNTGQKFAEAKAWYEYIFDPTERTNYWKFLPFLTVDIQALIDSCTGYLQELKELGAAVTAVEGALTNPVFATLKPLVPVFQQVRTLSPEEETALEQTLNALYAPLKEVRTTLERLVQPAAMGKQARINQLVNSLQERIAIIDKLWSRYQLLGSNQAQISRYLHDPFDPHAIAALRTNAYRKAVVMSYIDNLLDWGDLLFRQYTRESIDEARMLYILAYDLLGEKPENLGAKLLRPAQKYAELANATQEYDLVVYPKGTPHDSVANPYFFIPENSLFGDYWTRVEDRLYKIRQSLNILGISQPLPLFQPPIDPMALVQAVSAGAGISSALAGLATPVPHYRFSFMLRKAQDLVQKVNGFGNDLLAALEKKDAEELSLLQNRQEALILEMTRAIKQAQVDVAAETVKELEASLQGANDRFDHYTRLIDEGLLPIEEAQIGLMISASVANFVSVGLKVASGIAYILPEVTVGLFSFGAKTGGIHAGEALSGAAEAAQSLSEGLSMVGEALGIYATHQRTVQDWELQLSTAQSDVLQIGHQLAGARLQAQIAQHELKIHEQEIAHNAAIKRFMQGKFSNAQLYQWMAGKLSGIYFQSYNLAYEMAKAAEKAFQFERGLKESDVNYIQPLYWESQKNGLLAGASLGLDLDRMEKAYIDSDSRGFEISKNISLLELDPVALLQLKSKGVCEFALSEALFDYDFPGHYCRQIRTVTLTFVAAEGQRLPVNATLTQLSHKTVLEPDAKAVKFLLDPKDQPPLTLRSDWKANQQIALSHVDEYEKNNGLFELRFDDERYLPFEGTGAVSTWRLELNGKKGAYNVNDLLDVTITLKYSAEQGGAVFANTVKGLLKPYPTARFFDVARDFPDAWEEFLNSDAEELVLTFTRDLFPAMSSSKITGLFARYALSEKGAVSFVLNNDEELTLKDGKFLPASGLSIASQGSAWSFALDGEKDKLENIHLVLGYTAKVS